MPAMNSTALARPARARGASLLRRLKGMAALRRERRALLELDAHLLRDLGIDAEDARREARRPPWDAPDHWHR